MRDEVRGPGGGRARWVAAAQAVCTGRARLKAGGHRARAGRTWNMPPNTVTLDVSRLSGWLNATAFCRVERRACDAGRGAGREAGGRGAAAARAAVRAACRAGRLEVGRLEVGRSAGHGRRSAWAEQRTLLEASCSMVITSRSSSVVIEPELSLSKIEKVSTTRGSPG